MKKVLSIILLILLFFVICISNSYTKNSNFLIGKNIVIDPGHGGLDPGTSYNDIYEKNINLKISNYLKYYLESLGASVILTHSEDFDLARPNANYRKKSDFDNRIKIINSENADLYLSIHLNFLEDGRYYGPQVFYGDKILAEIIQENLNNKLSTGRTVKSIPKNLYMYNKLTTPGVLIECGFLSNEYERNLLVTKTYQKKIAYIIAYSIKKYYE